jgi:predicted esterase
MTRTDKETPVTRILKSVDWREVVAVTFAVAMFALGLVIIVGTVSNPPAANGQPAPTPGVGHFGAVFCRKLNPTDCPAGGSSTDRMLDIDFWYPVTDTTGLPAGTAQLGRPGDPLNAPFPLPNTIQGGTNRLAGPNRIIVFSHGSMGDRLQNFSLYRHLASQGNIVAATNHPGHDLRTRALVLPEDGFGDTARNRHYDLQFTVTLTDALFGVHVKRESYNDPVVVAAGHSQGALSALTLGLGLDPYHQPDARIDAVVAINPMLPLLPLAGVPVYDSTGKPLTDGTGKLNSLTLPVYLQAGAADLVATPGIVTDTATALTSTSVKVRVDTKNTGHTGTTDVHALYNTLQTVGAPSNVLSHVQGTAAGACIDATDSCIANTHAAQEWYIAEFINRELP